jgi:hypothetical protein
MKDTDKTKEQRTEELTAPRQRITEMEASVEADVSGKRII